MRASCAASAGYADATVVTCADAVIAPGLVNGHDHTEYNAHPPLAHGQTRWQHRNGWRTGAGGEMALPKYSSTSDVKLIAAAELRFLVGGATTVNGSGGVGGLVRNAAAFSDKTQTEGLKSPAVFFDTFPSREGPDHLGVVSDTMGPKGLRMVINNWTDGAIDAEMDLLSWVPVTHHFRIPPPSRTARAATSRAPRSR